MKIAKASASYEDWLGQQLTIVPGDLQLKHQMMSQSAFAFLRATFYRFMQTWKELAGDVADAPKVLAVGDLHVANFGTWIDAEGRLIWGVNDFDETYPLPYTIDLVRLALSAHIAAMENHLQIGPADACDSILAGYQEAITSGGKPFVLEQEHKWLRDAVTGSLRDPVEFWRKMSNLNNASGDVPKSALRGIEKMLPESAEIERIAVRVAGLGSLGRERYVLLAQVNGGPIAREAKALCASACVWAGVRGGSPEPVYDEILSRAVRCLDPFVRLRNRWLIRRLAPYCTRVDLASLPKERDESRLLKAMGFETANIHLGTPRARKAIAADLKARKKGWLHRMVAAFRDATIADQKDWAAAQQRPLA